MKEARFLNLLIIHTFIARTPNVNLHTIIFIVMIKEEVIYEEESDMLYRRRADDSVFILTDEQKNNINKRLPRGFTLLKRIEISKHLPFHGDIEYVPNKRELRVASQQLSKQFVVQPVMAGPIRRELGKSEVGVDKAGLRFSQLPEGKSKQAEKIKNIIQRFRKHYKYSQLAQHLQRIGFMSAFLQIEAENKKNIHTIDSFKDRCMIVFTRTREVTYEEGTVSLINEMIDELLFHVEQARKLEFENSLTNVQKSIDKVTREISEIKESGNYYYRKKKRNEKNYDEKEVLYLSELIRALPRKELVGVMQIVEEKPFQQIGSENVSFDLSQLKAKKIREIQFYVKKKLSNHCRSRERKREKLASKIREKRERELREAKMAQGSADVEGGQPKEYIKSEVKEEDGISGKRSEVPAVGCILSQGENDLIFELDMEHAVKKETPREHSLFDMQDRLGNDFGQEFLQDKDDLFFGEGEQSVRGVLHSERNNEQVLAVPQDNVEFEQANFLNYQAQLPDDYDSSDSSMITDEQDSEY